MDVNSELELGVRRKRPVLQEGYDQLDRISDLSDHLIVRVLSYLKTQEVVRTSILSSRWRYLWKGVDCISLEPDSGVSDPDKFANLVEHVLRNCCTTNFLKFNLVCPKSMDVSRLNTWISCLNSCKFENLRICISNADDDVLPEYLLPQCLLSCSTLVALELRCLDVQLTESIVNFPHLKSLSLQVVFPNSESAVCWLLSSCPVLENLELFVFLDNIKELNLDISIPSLKKLKIQLKDVGNSYETKNDVIINAPNLEILYIEDDSSAQYLVKNLPRVSDVVINYDSISVYFGVPENFKYTNHLFELLKGIIATEVLTLCWHTIDVLGSATLGYTWPTFLYLHTLIMQLNLFSGWNCFAKVLSSAPRLELLILDLEGLNDDSDYKEEDEYRWNPPDIVPACLLDHLKLIGIQCFEGNKHELQVVKYILNNSRVLEHMMIGYLPDYRNEEVMKKLMTFSTASKTCNVQIYERVLFTRGVLDNNTVIWGV